MKLYISHLGPQGDGIAKTKRGIVFVDRAAPRETVEASLYKDRKGATRAAILDLIDSSPFRSSPPCPHFSDCGNCSFQHLTQNFYRDWKIELVKTALLDEKVKVSAWEPPVFLPGKNRRRITITASLTKSKLTLGYYQRRTRNVFNLTECEIVHPDLFLFVQSLRPFISLLVKAHNKIDVFFQKSENQYEMIFLSPVDLPPKTVKELKQNSNLSRLGLKSEKGIRVLFDKQKMVSTFGSLKVKLPPFSFLQPTEEGERALVKTVLQPLKSHHKIADLFSGSGTFSGPLLSKGFVSAYESNPESVSALKAAAQEKPLKAFRRDLFKNPLKASELEAFDAVVFDPPRAGCLEQAKQLARSSCPILIGVSCNPQSFARDAKIITHGGYRLVKVQVIDQFLWSHHVELVGVFSRNFLNK